MTKYDNIYSKSLQYPLSTPIFQQIHLKNTMSLHFQDFLPMKTAKYGPKLDLWHDNIYSVETFTQALKISHNRLLRWFWHLLVCGILATCPGVLVFSLQQALGCYCSACNRPWGISVLLATGPGVLVFSVKQTLGCLSVLLAISPGELVFYLPKALGS